MILKDNSNLINEFKNVVEPILCTKLMNQNGVSVSTVEHLMAAFYGEGIIDNALVEVDAPEIPIMDGSAVDFVDAIKSVGEKQNQHRKFIKALKKIEVKDGKKFISIEPLKNDSIIDFEIIFNNPLIRTRRKEFKMSDNDLTAIYNSRTFAL